MASKPVVINFRLSEGEAMALDDACDRAGMTRSDYIRTLLKVPVEFFMMPQRHAAPLLRNPSRALSDAPRNDSDDLFQSDADGSVVIPETPSVVSPDDFFAGLEEPSADFSSTVLDHPARAVDPSADPFFTPPRPSSQGSRDAHSSSVQAALNPPARRYVTVVTDAKIVQLRVAIDRYGVNFNQSTRALNTINARYRKAWRLDEEDVELVRVQLRAAAISNERVARAIDSLTERLDDYLGGELYRERREARAAKRAKAAKRSRKGGADA